MIKELEKKDYKKIRHLFEDRDYVNSFRSHLERTPITKRVLVDDTNDPQTAVIVVPPRLFIGGRADNEEFNQGLRNYIHEVLIFEYKKRNFSEVDFYFSNDQWELNLPMILEDSFHYDRYYYEIKELKQEDWKNLIPEGYSVEPVDLTLLRKTYLKNFDWLIEEILENWEPLGEGLKENRGFYLVKEDDEIVAWCTTEYLTETNDIEVGIATKSEYQRRDFASIVGSATAEYCLARYKSVGWHCTQRNVGSFKTAEKIGFERIMEYRKASYVFNKVDLWVIKAYFARMDENYPEAIDFYNQIIEASHDQTVDFKESYYINSDFPIKLVYFRISSCYAAIENKEKSTEFLEKAISNGYKDKEQFLDSDLLTKILEENERIKYLKSM